MSVVPNKKCGRCEKIVYPTEEIKCLDKYWHKGCLKCTVCGMTLNVKNLKGYEKMPYCHAHYPQPKPTVVVDNPEMQRIRLLTDIQSNAKYHEDFNKSKGKFTVVADDPALTRAKEQQRIVSQAEYTGKRKDNNSQIISNDNNGSMSKYNSSELRVGRVADYDPINDDRGSLSRGYEPTSKAMQNIKYDTNQNNNYKSDNGNHNDTQSTLMKVRALYSYTAAESDEISFAEGDTIIECEHIDAGWMLGRHPRTGKQGLLPSNYVEIIG
ncbi:unnamed protein product [Adineta ricciae]|uniref:Uncharacterized protein n=1 Tax=Adineta ricciae TaxID=249248 RepID=A0A815FEM2_ADIRI|nr:unnamed protein product [Adineta ricciae]CAF1413105.1 unnamed protein product [Adineta ricciae]